jgi:hypothetical protein
MRKALNPACWDCRFYLALNGAPACCVTAKNVPITMMPMRCEKQEKVKNAGKS